MVMMVWGNMKLLVVVLLVTSILERTSVIYQISSVVGVYNIHIIFEFPPLKTLKIMLQSNVRGQNRGGYPQFI